MKWCVIVVLFLSCIAPLSAQEASTEELSLNQAIELSLKNNLSIEVQSYNPEIDQTFVNKELSRFEPFFGADISTEDRNTPSGSTLVGLGSINTKTQLFNFSWNQLLKTGTSYSVGFNNARVNTDQFFTSFNPRYDSTIFANVTQPLSRNFGVTITKTPLMIAEKNRLTSDYQLQTQVADIALQVEQSYWDLVFARGQLDVVQQALDTAQTLYENNKKQVEVGTMAPLEVVVAQAEVAARQEDIIRAKTQIKNTEDFLRVLIFGRNASNQSVVPTDQPTVNKIDTNEDDAIARAIANNPDLKALESDIQSKTLNSKLAKNELKPQVDLKAQFGGSGLGGDRLLLGGDDPFNPIVIGTINGGYSGAFSNLFSNTNWSLGVLVGIPVGNGSAKADYARAQLLEKQSGSTFDQRKAILIQSVRAVLHNLEDNLTRLDAAHASRVLQEQKLDAERKKLDVGLSTNYVVLDYTKDLAQSQSDELQAMVDYNKNLAQLKRFYGEIVK